MSPHIDLIQAGVVLTVIALGAWTLGVWWLARAIIAAGERRRRAVEWAADHHGMKPYKPDYEAIRTLQRRLKK